MDPALQELIAEGAPDEDVAVVVRLNPKSEPPPGLRIVARFGTVATARAARQDLRRLHSDPAIASLKAPRLYAGEIEAAGGELEYEVDESDTDPTPDDRRRPPGLAETGKGCVIAVIDWGCDFAHPDFRTPGGGTRLIALWDQRSEGEGNPYGYGRIHSREAIDRALAETDPFEALGYRPTLGPASHGTHVLGIAAGNGAAGGPAGIAPEADIVFCHLGSGGGDLGSSIELLEAIHFAAKCAGTRPLAFNLSIGRHAGPHDGTLLIERAIDWLLVNRPGTAIVQSAGNYYSRDVHMSGRLREQTSARLPFRLGKRDKMPVSIEIWYSGADEFSASVRGPDGAASAARGAEMPLLAADGTKIGHLYHRGQDPNNGDNLVNLFLYEPASSGDWEIGIEGVDVVDGRWHAWIERNAACRECQAQFTGGKAEPSSTTGSICNSLRTIAVGAYDGHDAAHPLAPFSSVGPTRDGRRKPLLAAPGVRILSVRSRPQVSMAPGYVRMSGTSMAAPHVTGTMVLMMQAAGGRPKVATMRRLLFSTLKPAPVDDPRWGYGRLDIGAAVAAARALAAGGAPLEQEAEMESAEGGAGAEWPLPVAPDAGTQPLPPPPPDAGDVIARLLGGGEAEADAGEMLRQAIDPEDPSAAVVGWPRRRLSAPLATGDLIIRDLPDGRHLAVVEDPALLRRDALAAHGLVAEGPWPGLYVRVAEGGGDSPPFARRIAGPDGFVLPDLTILRLGVSGESDPSSPTPHPMIRKGSSGPAVAEAQHKLNRIHARLLAAGEKGLAKCPLEVDGKFGALTLQAVLAFQKRAFPDAPAEWDGVVGPRTWAMLDLLNIEPPAPIPLPIPPPPPPIIPTGATISIPVIVLPGVMGSRLRLAGLPDWDPDSTLTMLEWLTVKGPRKLAGLDFRSSATLIADHSNRDRQRRGWGALSADFYETLLEALERGLAAPHPCADQPGFVSARHPVWAFGYDWRQSNLVHARRLSAFIDEVLRLERAEQVILVTHSMGGLVARAALPLIEAKVMGIVHTVQPSVGAVVAARRVHTGFHPTIDAELGELFQEFAETLGIAANAPEPAAVSGEPVEASAIVTRLMTRIFSDNLFTPNPIYYGQLMARMPSAVELLPSDKAALAKLDWLRPPPPPGPIHDHYATAAPAAGGMIVAGLPAADAAQFRIRLGEAKAFHAGLSYHPRTGVLFGTGLKTDNAFNPSSKTVEVIQREGDGTVPAFSGRCPDLSRPLFRIGFPRQEHAECLKDKPFLATIVAGIDHIAQGRGRLAENERPNRARCQVLIA
jgi:subtilisin family serine protease